MLMFLLRRLSCLSFPARHALKAVRSVAGVHVAAALFALCLAPTSLHAQTAVATGQLSTFGSTGSAVQNVAIDASGNIYYGTSSGAVMRGSFDGTTGVYSETTVITASGGVTALAVTPSAGNIFVVTTGGVQSYYLYGAKNAKYELSSNLGYDGGAKVATDAGGDLFLLDSGGTLHEYVSGSNTTLGTFANAYSMVADAAGSNIYISLNGTANLYRLNGSNYSYKTTNITNSAYKPTNLALDTAGNLYFTDAPTKSVYETDQSYTPYQAARLTGSLAGLGLAIDPSGNFYQGTASTTAGNLKVQRLPSFYNVPIGTAATQIAETFTILTAGKLIAPTAANVLTQGTSGLDYTLGTGSTCNGTTTYAVGATCTVVVAFTPRAPRVSMGAVSLRNASGTVIATNLLRGNGVGPALTFYPGVQSTILSGLPTDANGIASDANGNLYLSQGVNSIKETPNGSGGYTASTIPAYSDAVGSFAVDGAGNLYIPGAGGLVKKTYDPATGAFSSGLVFYDLTSNSVAVDSLGNIYGAAGGIITKLTPTNFGSYTESNINGSTNSVTTVGALTTDNGGNVFACDSGQGFIFRFSGSGTAKYSQSLAASLTGSQTSNSTTACSGIAVDASGTLYVTASGVSKYVLRFVPGGSYPYTYSQIGNAGTGAIGQPNALAVDSAGNIYVTNDSGGNSVVKIAVSKPVPIVLPDTPVNNSSPVQTVTLGNIGNAALTFPIPSTGQNPSISAPFTISNSSNCPLAYSTSSSAGTLGVAASCTDSLSFSPTTAGQFTGSLVFTDNNLNVAGATQTVPLSGKGYYPQPVITSVLPGGGPPAGGTSVTITGTGLLGATGVQFGSTAVSFTVNSDTSISAVSPAGTGVVDIVVAYNTTSSPISAADQFSYGQPQAINFTQPVTPASTGASPTMIATGGASGMPVTFSIVSGPATVSGTNNATVTYTGVGTVVIAANEAAAPGYAPAPQVTRSVTVVNQSVFVANGAAKGAGSVSSYYTPGAPSAIATGGGIGAAVDGSGNVWSVNLSGDSLTTFTDAGALLNTYSGAGINNASALVIDGAGVVWIANAGSLSALTSAGAPASNPVAFAAGIGTPASVSIDAAGSLWLANPANNTVTEVIGAAAPTVAPAVTAVINKTMGTRP